MCQWFLGTLPFSISPFPSPGATPHANFKKSRTFSPGQQELDKKRESLTQNLRNVNYQILRFVTHMRDQDALLVGIDSEYRYDSFRFS